MISIPETFILVLVFYFSIALDIELNIRTVQLGQIMIYGYKITQPTYIQYT